MNGIDKAGEVRRFLTMLTIFLSIYATLATFVLTNAA